MTMAALKQAALPRPLAGRHIVVTRPAEQSRHLAELIAAAGGEVLLFPVLSISDIEDKAPLLALAARLEEFDLAVFVSPNAVERALAPILAQRAWPQRCAVATVGKGSERALARFGFTQVIAPSLRFDSEGLLALPELQPMAGRRVVIFRGDGGRQLLGDTLQARGASVEYVSCYRRANPHGDLTPLTDLWARRQCVALTVTSSEGLRNLYEMLDGDGRQALARTPLFVPHQRIAEEAGKLGLTQLIATPGGDEGLVAGLIAYFSRDEHGT